MQIVPRAVRENLSEDAIKKAVTTWRPDPIPTGRERGIHFGRERACQRPKKPRSKLTPLNLRVTLSATPLQNGRW